MVGPEGRIFKVQTPGSSENGISALPFLVTDTA